MIHLYFLKKKINAVNIFQIFGHFFKKTSNIILAEVINRPTVEVYSSQTRYIGIYDICMYLFLRNCQTSWYYTFNGHKKPLSRRVQYEEIRHADMLGQIYWNQIHERDWAKSKSHHFHQSSICINDNIFHLTIWLNIKLAETASA